MADEQKTHQVPFAEGVFTWPDENPSLIGSRCAPCGALAFPAQDGCPRCGQEGMERYLLPRRGRLYSWTSQGFLPKEPYAGGETAENFRPFGVGLVELEGGIRVEGRLTEADSDQLAFDMEMELVVIPFRVDPSHDAGPNTEVMVYAFQPAQT